MRFEVPQFIDVEDKIIGPLTWRQFLYLGGGIGMAVVLFLTTNLFIFVLMGLPIAILAGALSFYPVNNRPFSFFLEAVFNYARGQRLYLWRKKSDVVYRNSAPSADNPGNTQDPNLRTQKSEGGINSLSRKLELQALQKNE